MRTRPLPNRHAADLSDFFETVQATLNRNRAKGDLGDMTHQEIIRKMYEEYIELSEELLINAWQSEADLEPKLRNIEHEAADLAVCALSAWLWARQGARRQGKV